MKYPFVAQHDSTDCAAACMAMICLYYNKETTITRLRDIMGTDLKGTNLYGLSKCAESLGFENQAVRVDRDSFVSEYTKPCIANTITDDGMSHFVVVFKVTTRNVVIGDPANQLKRITIDEFFKLFSGVLLILKPTTAFSTDNMSGEKTFHRFYGLFAPQKKIFIFSIIASFLITLLGIASSLLSKMLMDEVLPYNLKNLLIALVIIFAAIGIIRVVIGFLRSWMMLFLSQRIDIPLMLGYFKHIYSLPMRFFMTRHTGDIVTRFSDAFTIKEIFTNIALTLVMDVVMAVITAVILAKMNAELFGIIVIMTFLSVLLMLIFRIPYKKINIEQMQQASILNSRIIEGLEGIETIKVNANEEATMVNLEKEYIKSLRIAFKEGWLSNIQGGISELISVMGSLVLIFFGMRQVMAGNTTLGTFMAFMTLSEFFMEPVSRLVAMQLDIQEANISMKRISEIMDYKKEDSEQKKYKQLEKVDGKIEIKNLTFRYGNRAPVLNDVSFSIEPGSKVAIVGASGSGKSTLVKLILKYYEAESGSILINNTNIREYSCSSLRNKIAYVPQNIDLFSKSVIDNIRIGNVNATEREIKEASRMSYASEFINKMPLGYYTYLEESGEGLSGGEKQRIALARAIIKDSSFFILDEPTSNLDFGHEKNVINMLFNHMKGKTILIVAHRLSTVMGCDKIIVMDEGRIVEEGTHEELLTMKGTYASFWQLQRGEKQISNSTKECNDSLHTIDPGLVGNEITYT